MNKLYCLIGGLFLAAAMPCFAIAEEAAARPIPENPSNWRGFNLGDKGWRDAKANQPYREWDFQKISEFGFNFVRLAIDYRVWLVEGEDRRVMNEKVMKEIDQAVEWGGRYGVHVDISLHRAPGYCVNPNLGDEDNKLWHNKDTQDLFVYYWEQMAARYKGISNARVSFNLVNEPHRVTGAVYVAIAKRACDAIWAIDPERMIMSDWDQGNAPLAELDDPRIWQSSHNYKPSGITNYGVTWRDQDWIPFLPTPRWPTPMIPQTLLGPIQAQNPYTTPEQKEFAGKPVVMLDLKDFPGGVLRIRLSRVSGNGASMQVLADDRVLGSWEVVPFKAILDAKVIAMRGSEYFVKIPAGTKRIGIASHVGDWIDLGEIGLKPEGGEEVSTPTYFANKRSNERPEPVKIDFSNKERPFDSSRWMDADWLYESYYRNWHEQLGSHFFVGEFGCFSGAPHVSSLAWIEDNLKMFKRMNVGWALWEFRGNWGIINSNRADVAYEDMGDGNKLDRKMLELLQRYK